MRCFLTGLVCLAVGFGASFGMNFLRYYRAGYDRGYTKAAVKYEYEAARRGYIAPGTGVACNVPAQWVVHRDESQRAMFPNDLFIPDQDTSFTRLMIALRVRLERAWPIKQAPLWVQPATIVVDTLNKEM